LGNVFKAWSNILGGLILKVNIFLPKLFLKDVYEIDINLLKKYNIKGLILDVDNTLVEHYVEKPCKKLIDWVNYLKKNSIKLCIVSNGSLKRVTKFNEDLGLDIISKARKPFKRGFLKGLEVMNLDKNEVAVVGDQLFTDVLGGNLLGMFTILVEMISPKEAFSVHLKRYLERLVLKKAK